MSLITSRRKKQTAIDPATVTLISRFRSELGPSEYVYVFGFLGHRYTLYATKTGAISANVSQVDPDALHTMLHLINNDLLDRA